ncbi:MAG: ABC transporter permease [Rhodospirillales bacterium]|nr:ABC transporter permease [Rhodospirillales bacterium]
MSEAVAAPVETKGRPFGWQVVLAKPEYYLSPAFLVLLLVVWEGSTHAFDIPDYILPPPSKIGISLFFGIKSGLFIHHFLVTAFQALCGFTVAAFLGIGVGALVAQFWIVEKTVYPYLVALQTLPKIAIAPLIIIWAGYGIQSKVVIAALVSFFPVLVNTIVGLKTCDQGKLDLMRALRATRWETFRMVKLPNALPFVFAGLNIALIFSILGSIVGEFVGSKAGLGNLILEANFQFNIAQVFAILVILGAFGVSLNLIIQAFQRRLIFWSRGADLHTI